MKTPLIQPAYQVAKYSVQPIPFKAHKIQGFTAKNLERHYESYYGNSIQKLNQIENNLDSIQYLNSKHSKPNSLLDQKLNLLNEVILHELYFDCIAEENSDPLNQSPLLESINTFFGGFTQWQANFIGLGESLNNKEGWVILGWCDRLQQLLNIKVEVNATIPVAVSPILAIDMYQHAYQIDYGSNSLNYIHAFIECIHWEKADKRFNDIKKHSIYSYDTDFDTKQINIEQLRLLNQTNANNLLVIDVRHEDDRERYPTRILQTPWRDSFCVSEWAHEYPKHKTIIVYCMYGFWVSQQVAQQLRHLGFDARSLNGGICAWRAMGYPSTSINT